MISREVNTRESGFAYIIEEKFSYLNIAALVKHVAENSLSCAFSCLKHLACFSFNFAAFPDKTGKFTCEILSSDKYNNSKSLLPSKTFHHFSIVVSNLSLNFPLTFGQPECLLIKRQNSRYPIRNWYTFCLLTFLRTDTKLKTNLELREKSTRVSWWVSRVSW